MKFIITLCFTFLLMQTNAQKNEKYFDYTWKECELNAARFYSIINKTDSGYNRKAYYIHERSIQMSGKYEDESCKIPNGQFYYFHANNVLQLEGKYIHGKRDGLWLLFYNNSVMQDSTIYVLGKPVGISLSWHPNGFMKDSTNIREDGSSVEVSWFDNGNPSSAGILSSSGKQIGKWKYYHRNGNLSAEEIYENGTLVDSKYFSENGLALSNAKSKDKNEIFRGGNKDWQEYLLKGLYFPSQYKIVNADKAVVVVDFSISEEGNVEDVFVSTPFYPDFDRIAENLIKKSPKWEPAIKHNRKIKTWLRQPVTFAQLDY